MKLRPYQSEGFDRIIETMDSTDSPVMFVLATGGGKTVTFMQVIKYYLKKGLRVTMIAHREELINQAYRTLKRNGIYSGVIKAEYPSRYEFPCQVGSIQTMVRRSTPPTDVIIVDEGHHVTDDNSYNKVFQRYPDAKILMVTATPVRQDKKGFTEVLEGRSTKLIVNRTTKQLIDEGYLVPFKYFVASLPNLDKVRVVRGDYDNEEAYEAMKLAPIVESYVRSCNGMKGIVYAVNIKHSKEIADEFVRNGIAAAHLDQSTPNHLRRRILQLFRSGDIQVVVNVGILTEGADFPDCQFVQLACPTKSLSKYLQMVGRVTRPSVSVDSYDTIDQRKNAILSSEKPCGIVLDNAKCWKEHGFPDQDFNWELYFKGEPQKAPPAEMIEIYEIEDPETGVRRKTKSLRETEGAVLVEVSYEERVILNKKRKNPITEFNRVYFLAKRLKHVRKKGFFVWLQIKDMMLKGDIQPSEELYHMIEKKLITDIQDYAERTGLRPSDDPFKIPSQYFIKEWNNVISELSV